MPTDDDLFAALLPPIDVAPQQQPPSHFQQHGAGGGFRHQAQGGHGSLVVKFAVTGGAAAAAAQLPPAGKPPVHRSAPGGASKAKAAAAGVAPGLAAASLASLRTAYLAAFGRETTSNNRQWLLRRLQGCLLPGGVGGGSTSSLLCAPLAAGQLTMVPADGGAVGAQFMHLGVPAAGAPPRKRNGGGAKQQPVLLTTAELAARAKLAEEARDAVAAATFAAAAATVAAADVTHGAAALEEGAGLVGKLQPGAAAAAAAAAAHMLPSLSQHRGEGKRAVKPNRQFTEDVAAAAATPASAAKQPGGMRHAHSTTAMVATALGGGQGVGDMHVAAPAPPMTTNLTSPRLGHDMAAQLDAVASAARAAAQAARAAADAHREAAMAASGEGPTGSESPTQAAQTPGGVGSAHRKRPTTTAGRLVMKRVRTADAAARQAEAAASAAEAVAASCHALLLSPGAPGGKSPSRRVKKPRLMEDFVVDAPYSDSDAGAAAAAAPGGTAPHGGMQQPGGQAAQPRAKPRAPKRPGGGGQQRRRAGSLVTPYPLGPVDAHHPYGSLPLLPHGVFGHPDAGEGMDDVDEVDALFMEGILVPDHPALLAMHSRQQQPHAGGVAQHPYQQQLGLGGAHPPGSPHGSDVRPSAGLTPPADGGSAGGGGMQHPGPGGVDGVDLDVAMEVDVDIDVGDEHDDAAFTHALHECGLLSDEPLAPQAWHMAHGAALPGAAAFVWRVPAIPPQQWAQGAAAKRKKNKQRKATSGVSGDAQAGTPKHGRATPAKTASAGVSDASPGAAAGGQTVRRNKQHNPWALEEAEALVEGVARCGGGRWADIKKLGFPAIAHRTAVDLKDKWRNLLRIASLPSPGPKSAEKRRDVPVELLARVRHLAANQEHFLQHSTGAAPTPGKGGGAMGPRAPPKATPGRGLVLDFGPLDRGTPDSLS